MKQSTALIAASKSKPEKPYPDFPLTSHASGKWCKFVRGRCYYFGTWSDPDGALEEYQEVAEDLHAGRVPQPKNGKGGASIRDICNAFLKAQRLKLHAGTLSPRTMIDCDQGCKFLVAALGPGRAVCDLRPSDFEMLYGKFVAKRYSPATIKNEMVMIRTILKFAFDADLIEKPIKYGPSFRIPSESDMRKEKAKKKHLNGARTLEAAHIRALLEKASPQLRAMILLGINCGFGNTDCATLPLSAVDLRRGWVDFPRPKTGAERVIPLWPETVAALKAVIEARKEPTNPDNAQLVFLTRLGQAWVRFSIVEDIAYGKRTLRVKQDDSISKETTKLLKDLKLKRPGVSFYSLRHTFETISGGAKDQVATNAIMGHIDRTMAGNYRHHIESERLQAVVQHVREWLFDSKTEESA